MSSHAKLAEHLEAWKESYGELGTTFCLDGAIGDGDEWWTARPRVLFLSKDCNDSQKVMEPVSYDLRRLLRETNRASKHSKTFERELGRWACAIHRFAAGRTIKYEDISPQDAAIALLRAAVVNVKKLAGTSNLSEKELKSATARDSGRILRQIDILSPTFVVCCGTFNYLKHAIPDLEKLGQAARCFRRKDTYWIDQWHPSFRFAKGGPLAIFSKLMESVTATDFKI